MTPDLIANYSAPVPRYTSYPTAPHFRPAIGAVQYRDWLKGLTGSEPLSLYVHIPYCQQLCWYCGCNTKATRRYEPVGSYLKVLELEIDTVSRLLSSSHRVAHMHWGGGSPNILSAEDITLLASHLADRFRTPDTEFAVEIDPRFMSERKTAAFAAIGVNRVSVGVQDFDDDVQRAIGRLQSYEVTRQSIEQLRGAGIAGINLDLIYGLPRQTCDSLARTLDKVLTLAPERIAAFGYAHLPARLRPQRLIDETTLPPPQERFAQAELLARRLVEAGYIRVGLDHYAKASDSLVTGNLRRNFQGYTSDSSEVLIGLGASAIGRLPQGYVQNAVSIAHYSQRIRTDGLATDRGFALATEDRMRAHVIERLMCDFAVSVEDLKSRFGDAATLLAGEIRALLQQDRDGLLAQTGDGFSVTEKGRPFVRSICAKFDTYLAAGQARHASGV